MTAPFVVVRDSTIIQPYTTNSMEGTVAGMRYPRTHLFLKWVGPTFIVFIGGVLALIAAFAQAYPSVRDWAQNQFLQWEPVVTSSWFPALSIALIVGYVAALIYTGMPGPARRWTGRGLRALHRAVSGPTSIDENSEVVGTDKVTKERVREPTEWIPLHKALRYLVYETQWGNDQPAATDKEDFDRIVAAEARERLARGEIEARGRLGMDAAALQRATEPIPADFWINAFVQPHGEIALADDNQSYASTTGGGGPVYRAIILRKSDVEAAWPSRAANTGLTPLATCVEDTRARIEAERTRHKHPTVGEIVSALDDEVKEQDERARLTSTSLLTPRRRADVTAGRYRNVALAEALGWAVHGEWGKPFHGSPVTAAFIRGLGVGTDIYKLLARFTKLAAEGKLTIWGKRDDPGYYEKIPRSHWDDHNLALADIFGSITTAGTEPYRELMLNRTEVETQWPHEG